MGSYANRAGLFLGGAKGVAYIALHRQGPKGSVF